MEDASRLFMDSISENEKLNEKKLVKNSKKKIIARLQSIFDIKSWVGCRVSQKCRRGKPVLDS